MNICAFGRSLPVHQLGGMEYHFEDLTCALRKRGHNVTIITTQHPDGIEYEKKNGVDIYYLRGTLPGRYEFGFWKKSVKKFEELKNIKKFNLIYSESIAAYGYLKEKIKERSSLPVVLIAHGTFWGQILTKLKSNILSPNTIIGTLKNLYGYTLERKVYSNVDFIVAITQIVAEALIKNLNVAPNKIRIIPNGVDVEKFRPDNNLRNSFRKKLGFGEDERVILSAGRLHRAKGVQLTISAMPFILKHIPTKLLVIGEGEYAKKLKRLTRKLRLENEIVFLGRVPHQELAAYYNACDLFVMTTLEKEGLPLTLLEVMACKKAIVASRIGGISDLLEHGVTGILIKPGDKRDLVRQSAKLLQDNQLANSLAKRAWQKVTLEYSSKKTVKKLETLFMQAADSR